MKRYIYHMLSEEDLEKVQQEGIIKPEKEELQGNESDITNDDQKGIKSNITKDDQQRIKSDIIKEDQKGIESDITKDVQRKRKTEFTKAGYTVVSLHSGKQSFTEGLTALVNSLVKQ